METKGEYRGVPYESDSELYFLFWAFELVDKNIIDTPYRCTSYTISDGFSIDYPEVKKGKVVMKKQTILKPSIYTPDYQFIQHQTCSLFQMIERPHNVVMPEEGQVTYRKEIIPEKVIAPLLAMYIFDFPLIYVECKPDFDQNNMTRVFRTNQKVMWDRHKIFVNLVKTNEFFERTFCPAQYLKTKTGKDRKLNFTPRTLEQYLNG